MPFPGSAAASLPDGLRLQRRPYKLDSPPVVALASNNRGRQKRVLGGSGTPSWFLLCPAKIIVSREYVDYSCPSLCGRPLAAMMNLPAASFSWRHGLFGFKVQAVLLFGREIRTAACHSLCCYLFRGVPLSPCLRRASSYCCHSSANPRLCNTSPRPLLKPSFLALHVSPPSGVLYHVVECVR